MCTCGARTRRQRRRDCGGHSCGGDHAPRPPPPHTHTHTHPHPAVEGQHVVLTHGVELDVRHNHHSVAFHLKQRVAHYVVRRHAVALRERAQRRGDALRRLAQAVPRDVLAEALRSRPAEHRAPRRHTLNTAPPAARARARSSCNAPRAARARRRPSARPSRRPRLARRRRPQRPQQATQRPPQSASPCLPRAMGSRSRRTERAVQRPRPGRRRSGGDSRPRASAPRAARGGGGGGGIHFLQVMEFLNHNRQLRCSRRCSLQCHSTNSSCVCYTHTQQEKEIYTYPSTIQGELSGFEVPVRNTTPEERGSNGTHAGG